MNDRLRKETVFAVIIASKRLKVKFFALLVITSEMLPFRRHPPLPTVKLSQIIVLATQNVWSAHREDFAAKNIRFFLKKP